MRDVSRNKGPFPPGSDAEKELKRLLEQDKPQFPLGFVVFCFVGAAVGLAIILVAIWLC